MPADPHELFDDIVKRSGAEPEWYSATQPNARGGVRANHANAMRALRSDPAWIGVLGYDSFREQTMLFRNIPVADQPHGEFLTIPRPWSDTDDLRAQEWFQLAGLPQLGLDTVRGAISQRAQELKFHPIMDWLRSLKWDRTIRLGRSSVGQEPFIPSLLSTDFGALNNLYTDSVLRAFLISAVARVLLPGCKADHMLILEGAQGIGKSSAVRILAGEDFFSDSLPEISSKDAMAHLAGCWIIEIAELDAIRKAENSKLKAFLSRSSDRFRPAFGHRTVERPRQCVFMGTTNSDAYLRDSSGARRFWPVKVGLIDLEALTRDRDQLWAEAHHLYQQGEPWHFTDPDLIALARTEQDQRRENDAWEEPIGEFIRNRTSVTIMEILTKALAIDDARCDRQAQLRAREILIAFGWQRSKKSDKGQVWVPASVLDLTPAQRSRNDRRE